MFTQEFLGYLAGALTTLAVVPQIAKAWKTRAVRDISLITLVTLISGLLCWTIYGVVTGSWPLIVANGIAVTLNGLLLGLVIHERQAHDKRTRLEPQR